MREIGVGVVRKRDIDEADHTVVSLVEILSEKSLTRSTLKLLYEIVQRFDLAFRKRRVSYLTGEIGVSGDFGESVGELDKLVLKGAVVLKRAGFGQKLEPFSVRVFVHEKVFIFM